MLKPSEPTWGMGSRLAVASSATQSRCLLELRWARLSAAPCGLALAAPSEPEWAGPSLPHER